MNGQYLMRTPKERLLKLAEPQLQSLGIAPAAMDRERILRAMGPMIERSRTTVELAKHIAIRLDDRFVQRDASADKLIAKDPAGFVTALEASEQRLAKLSEADWAPDKLEGELRAIAEGLGVAAGKVFQPLRAAITGGTASEPVHELVCAVGKKGTLARLKTARSWAVPGAGAPS
jgi:glutamyl-tRNA synthetase